MTDNKFTGYADYVVTANGELRLGQSHSYLAGTDAVVAAGRARFVNGQLQGLDNWSGHFFPHGVNPAVPEGAFSRTGLNAEGLYKEVIKPKK